MNRFPRVASVALRVAIGTGVSIACVFLVLQGIDAGLTLEYLSRAAPIPVGIAVVAFGVDLLIRAIRWRAIYRPFGRPPLGRMLAVLLVGYLGNNVLPGRVGELARSHYLGRSEGVSRMLVLGTIVVERIADVVAVLLILLLAQPFVTLRGAGTHLGSVLVITTILILLGMALVAGITRWHAPTHLAPVRTLLNRRPRYGEMLERLGSGLRSLRTPSQIVGVVLTTLLAWLMTSVAFLMAGAAVGMALSVPEAIVLAAGVNLVTAIPAGPGYFGTFELAATAIAVSLGYTPSVGLALAVLVHAISLLITTLGGLVSLWIVLPRGRRNARFHPARL